MMGHPRRISWTQPSLSRDFALLTASILFIMLLISAWVTWITYVKHSEHVIDELRVESARIERTLDEQMKDTGFLLSAAGKLIAAGNSEDLPQVARLLQIFADNRLYAGLFWMNGQSALLVNSTKGVMQQPVILTDRDYVVQSAADPGVAHIGAPIEGRVSNRWVIPVGYGVTDSTGRLLGTVSASIDIDALTRRISRIVQREGISFAIISKSLVPLTTVADSQEFVISQMPLQKLASLDLKQHSQGVMSRAPLLAGGGIYAYYLASPAYPYIIVVGYDSRAADSAFRNRLWPLLLQIMVVAGFLLLLLWVMSARVIRPVAELAEIAGEVAAGKPFHAPGTAGPQEVSKLTLHIRRIADYITERLRIEAELHNKIGALLKRVEQLQLDLRSRAALLSGLMTEYKQSLRNINGYAQVLKDQLYGPLENKKYRQYAADIHQAGTALELMVRKLIALSRMDTGAVLMREEAVALTVILEQALRYVADSMPGGSSPAVATELSQMDGLRARTDGLYFQQALAMLMLYLITPAGTPLQVQFRRLGEGKARERFMLVLGMMDVASIPAAALMAAEPKPVKPIPQDGETEEAINARLHLELAQTMLTKLQLHFLLMSYGEQIEIAVIEIPPSRIMDPAAET